MHSVHHIEYIPTAVDDAGHTKYKVEFHRIMSDGRPLFFNSLEELFNDPAPTIERIPSLLLKNAFYSLHHVDPDHSASRTFAASRNIGFDIDAPDGAPPLDDKLAHTLANLVCEVLKLDPSQTAQVITGYGLQLIIELEQAIPGPSFFQMNREAYKNYCKAIDFRLAASGLLYTADPAVFDAARVFRMPGTTNAKPDREPAPARCIQPNLLPQFLDFNFTENPAQSWNVPTVLDFVHADAVNRDSRRVDALTMTGLCEFFKANALSAHTLPEPHWWKEAGVLAFLPGGDELFHVRSSPYPGYSPKATAAKLDQIRARQPGPSTCESINGLWGKCDTCAYYKKVKTPALIPKAGEELTAPTGYYIKKERGLPKFNHEDMASLFTRTHHWKIRDKRIWTYDESRAHWVEQNEHYASGFAQKHARNPNGDPFTAKEAMEFSKHLERLHGQNPTPGDFWADTVRERINLRNGVMDLPTRTLRDHSPDYGFTYQLDYDFDPDATDPEFESMILDGVTQNNAELKNYLEEVLGYCISGDIPWLHKAFIFTGEGRNGKSTLMNIVKSVIEPLVSEVAIQHFKNDNAVILMRDKVLNISGEVTADALYNSAAFKSIVAGDPVLAKKLYVDLGVTSFTAKQIILCNELPKSADKSYALAERLAVIPFNATFTTDTKANERIEYIKQHERAGILNRLLKAYMRLKERRRLPHCDLTKEAKEGWERENEDLRVYFDEEWEIYPLGDPKYNMCEISKAEVYQHAADWLDNNRMNVPSATNFWKRARACIPDFVLRECRMNHGGKRSYSLKGIAKRIHHL